MSQKQITQWRSVGFAAFVMLVLTAAFLWAVVSGKASSDVAVMFGSLCTSGWIVVAFAFGKSLGEKAADGAGLKGMARVLMTDQKPGDPAKE